MFLTLKFCFDMFSESQKKVAASSSQKKFDMISSAVRSALGRLGKESVTVEVSTHSDFLHVWFFCTGHDQKMCMFVTLSPWRSVGLLPFPRCPCIPERCAQTHIPKSLLCLCCGPSSPVGVFDYFFKWIWIITADCPWVGIVIDIC